MICIREAKNRRKITFKSLNLSLWVAKVMTSSNHLTVILNSKPMRGLWLQINLLSMIGPVDLMDLQLMTGQVDRTNLQ